MNYYIINQDKKAHLLHNKQNPPFKRDDLFLLFRGDLPRLYGLYKIKRIYKHKRTDHYTFVKFRNYRRSLDGNDLLYNKIRFKFSNDIYIKISKSKFNFIMQMLEKKNSSQTISDYLFIDYKDHQIRIDYIQNHPVLLNIKKSINCNIKRIELIKKLTGQLVKRIINFNNSGNELCELEDRIRKTFFPETQFLKNTSDRFVSLKTDKALSGIPFEVMLLNSDHNFYISRLVEINDIKANNKYNFSPSIKFIFPKYKRLKFDPANEIKLLKKKIKNKNYEMYYKPFKITEFIRLLENSYMVHFSGHTVFNRKRKEYGLKINDHDIFYFSDFTHCLNLPDLLTFHSCFEFKHLEHLNKGLQVLFQNGVKNVLLPYTEIRQEIPFFFFDFYNHILNGMETGKAFKFIINSFSKEQKYFPLLFRLYGNPMEKYFKKFI